MKATKGIFFQEISSNPVDFLHDLADPNQGKGNSFPPSVARALRRQQVNRLESNIGLLRRKQEEFNRKMEEYIQNIRALIGSLERSIAAEGRDPGDERKPERKGATQVRCLTCGVERLFQGLHVLVAHESAESFTRPTELIVQEGETIKKGTFSCGHCGNENLLIRKVG